MNCNDTVPVFKEAVSSDGLQRSMKRTVSLPSRSSRSVLIELYFIEKLVHGGGLVVFQCSLRMEGGTVA